MNESQGSKSGTVSEPLAISQPSLRGPQDTYTNGNTTSMIPLINFFGEFSNPVFFGETNFKSERKPFFVEIVLPNSFAGGETKRFFEKRAPLVLQGVKQKSVLATPRVVVKLHVFYQHHL